MNYIGKLYGKIGNKHFDTGKTAQDWDYLEMQVKKLQAFKDYVHDRLDKMGIEKDPESEHKEHGCRIGGRLDIVESFHESKSKEGWIDINDRNNPIPKDMEDCLILLEDGIIRRHSEDWEDEFPLSLVTHWHPLPTLNE